MADRHPHDGTTYELTADYGTFTRASTHDTKRAALRQIEHDRTKAERDRPRSHTLTRIVRKAIPL